MKRIVSEGQRMDSGANCRHRIESFSGTAAFRDLLDEKQKEFFLEQVIRKYHYPYEECGTLSLIFDKVRTMVMDSGAVSFQIPDFYDINEKISPKAVVVITLGGEIDHFQDENTANGLLSENYMTEVIAGELLLLCYPVCNQRLKELCQRNVERYSFVGSSEEYGLNLLPGILRESGLNICCNSSYYIIPKKSVAFMAHLTLKEADCPGICVGCGSLNCPNRIGEEDGGFGRNADLAGTAFNYGFARIFGRKYT